MDLVLWDGIMLGEIRQKRQKLHDFTLHEKSWKNKQTNKQNRTLKNVELYQKISHTCTWSPTEDKTEN